MEIKVFVLGSRSSQNVESCYRFGPRTGGVCGALPGVIPGVVAGGAAGLAGRLTDCGLCGVTVDAMFCAISKCLRI